MLIDFFLLGSSSLELLSLRFFDALDELLLTFVLIFSMGVGCSIRKVAFSTGAAEVSAFGVFAFSPAFALFLHSNIQEMKLGELHKSDKLSISVTAE